MALLHIPPSGGDILVVGDGNFSFSLCLAAALSKANFHHTIVATSLDRREQLVNNEFAQENLDIITASFSNVEIIHGVDATDLACSFGSRKFGRIIFNFPHTGGKSNIRKSRQLLAHFFASAGGHILPTTGEVCVSLCQGQGGTSEDMPQRGYGNTWQVVEHAAKADLMLKYISPFTSSDYPQYKSAGFRGLLDKGFHTIGGLTHTFVHGTPLMPIPEFGESSVAVTDCRHEIPAHPICMIREKLETFFTELSVKDINDFEIFAPVNHVKAKECEGGLSNLVRGESTSQNCHKQHKHFLQQVTENLEKTTGSFIVTNPITHFSLPVTKTGYPTTEHMVVVRRGNCSTVEQLIAELADVIGMFIKEICPNIETLLNIIEGNADEQNQIANEKLLPQQCCGPPDKMFRMGRVVDDDDDKSSVGSSLPECSNSCVAPERFCLHAGESCCRSTRIHDVNLPFSENCELCSRELSYSGQVIEESSKWVSAHLTKSGSQYHLVYKETILVACGLLRGRAAGVKPAEHPPGWIIEVNLDALLMALYNIPDARLLHSCDPNFVKQFASIQEPDRAFHFTPFSLYPPSYTHDISFWLEAGATEEQFLQAIYRLTQNCVQDVLFKERYYDKDSGRVSYNYRMVYSRCDGPMTHLQSVNMQNLLRRNLMALGFALK